MKARYSLKCFSGHPLAKANGQALVHRLVLWDHIGPGEHKCHWCGCKIRWDTGSHKSKAWRRHHEDGTPVLVADHLNYDTFDNRPENIVPACFGCNSNRDKVVRPEEPHSVRGKNKSITRGEARVCRICGRDFVVVNSQIKSRPGLFCSHKCGALGRTGPRRSVAMMVEALLASA